MEFFLLISPFSVFVSFPLSELLCFPTLVFTPPFYNLYRCLFSDYQFLPPSLSTLLFFFLKKKKCYASYPKKQKKRKEKKSELFKKKKKVSSGSVSFDLFCVSSAFSFSYPASSRDVGLFCCSFSLSSRYKKSDDEQKKDKKSSNLFVFFSFTCSPSRCRCGCRRSRSRPRCRRLRPSLLASERRLRP